MVTQIQSDLIMLLKSFGLDKETTTSIVVLCRTDENCQKMIDEIIYRYDQKGTVTEQDIQKIGLYLTGTRKTDPTLTARSVKDLTNKKGELK